MIPRVSVQTALEPTSAVIGILEEYLEGLEAGVRRNPAELAGRCPELTEPLKACLASLEFLQDAAVSLRGSKHNGQPADAEGVSSFGRLGDYHILREVGRGGMGVVYEAEQISLGRRVALKVLPFAAALDDKQLQRFKNEAHAAACLHHTNIVPIFGVGCDRSVHYYAMQYIEGRTLAALIEDLRHGNDESGMKNDEARIPKAIPEAAATDVRHSTLGALSSFVVRHWEFFRTVARLGMQAAEALEHAHEFGVVHRDIKPANLLLDVRGNLWITDFGLAHCRSQAGLTITGDLVGTLRYMSPEQALARRAGVDHQTDIYSLGATLYELLTLEPAFNGGDRQELLRQIAFEEPKPPRRLNQAVPAELETIVLKAMAKYPSERYATARELANDLQRFLKDEPILARRPTPAQRMRKWMRRHRPAVWSGAAALVVALAALTGSVGWIMRDRATQQARNAASVQSALDEARRFQREAKWTEARAAAKRAEALLSNRGDRDSAPLRQGVEELLADLRMVAKVEEVRLQRSRVRDGHFDYEGADRGYAAAFRDFGIDVETLSVREAAKRIAARAIRAELAAALDHWAETSSWIPRKRGKNWHDLLAVARAADPDSTRAAVREALLRRDKQALLRLAASEEIWSLPPATQTLLAGSLAQMGNLQEATVLLRRVQEKHSGDFWINHTLADYLFNRGRPHWNDAIAFYTAAVALRPDSAGARLNLGAALTDSGRLDEALSAYRRAMELKPDYVEAHDNIGLVHYAQGRFNEAVAAHRRAIDLKPAFAEAHQHLGAALCRAGRLDEALSACRRAIDLNPDSAENALGLGIVLSKQGRHDEAAAAFRKSIRFNPDCAEAHYNLGTAFLDMGRPDEAVTELRQAVEQKPDLAEAHCNLGIALRRQGEFAEASIALKRGHELGVRRDDWAYASSRWVMECQRLAELQDRLPAVLRGETQATDAVERSAYALHCYDRKYYVASARLWKGTLSAYPELAGDFEAGYRHDAACVAALAGSGKGADAAQMDDKERARWRKQALEWLHEDVTAYGRLLESGKQKERKLVLHRLRNWQRTPNLAGLRDQAAVAQLPDEEQERCKRLWADVQALLTRADADD